MHAASSAAIASRSSCPTAIDWVVAYLGVIWAGGVAVGVNPRVPANEWLAILDAAGFLFILAEAGDDTPAPWSRQVISLADWRRELAHAAPGDAEPMGPEDPVLWVHSSGTSGHPKAVVHPQRIALEIERIGRERLGLTADDRIYASSKLFFAYPLANCIFAGLKLGADDRSSIRSGRPRRVWSRASWRGARTSCSACRRCTATC